MNDHAQPLRRIQWRARVLAQNGAPFLCSLVARGHREETLDDRHDPAFESWLRGETVETTAPGEVERRPEHTERWAELDAMRAVESRLDVAARRLGVPLDVVPVAAAHVMSQIEALRAEAEVLRVRASGLGLLDTLKRCP